MKKLFLAMVAVTCAVPSLAAEGYAGASVGRAEQKLNVAPFSMSDSDTGYKAFVGYQFTPVVGLEAGYARLGESSIGTASDSVSAKPKSVYLAVTGTVPVNAQVGVFGKVGVVRSRTTLNFVTSGISDSFKERETSALLGIGASYAFNPAVAVIVEYEHFGKVLKEGGDDLKADLLSVGVRFKF